MPEIKDMSTKVDGNPTGDVTESGNPNHQGDGKFGTKKTKKQIDTDFSVPFCNHKIIPVMNQICQEENAAIYELTEPSLKLSEDLIEELDKNGTDYVIIKSGNMYSVDLKTVTTGDGTIPDYINIPLWHFDENYKDEQTGVKGKQNYGWGLKYNDTHAYLFSLPTKIETSDVFSIQKHSSYDFDAFFIKKDEFKKILFENYFDDGINTDGHNALKSLRNSMFTVNKQLIEEIKNRKTKKDSEEKVDLTPGEFNGFEVEYYKNGKPKFFRKFFVGKDGYPLSLVMHIEYVKGEQFPRQNIYLQCHKNVFKKRDVCQLLNPKENKNNVMKKFFNI